MRIHLIGICGAGMAGLAGLLKALGHQVSGSDRAFHAPMSEALERAEIATQTGFQPDHINRELDLVVVGNVCRRDNVEATEAVRLGIRSISFPHAIEEFVLPGRPSWVVAGTHGKTTTTSLVAHLLTATHQEPGFLVGGIPRGLGESYRLGNPAAPFVIEGDEYDSAFFEKRPKFWRYRPFAAILTSVEHDHIDIYPDMDTYRAAFRGFVERLPPEGRLLAYAGDSEVRGLATQAKCRVVWYALEDDDCGEVNPQWVAAPVAFQAGGQPFDAFVGGSSLGRLWSPLAGKHNLRNALGALALVAEGEVLSVRDMIPALKGFKGVQRRQELIATVRGIHVYDDFAHHPTAVRETLAALRAKHPQGRLVAVFEPRSATASRQLHQAEYPKAFREAALTLLAPVARKEIPVDERLDTETIASALNGHGCPSEAAPSHEAIIDRVASFCQAGDTVVIMSNGTFGNIHDRIIVALATPDQISRF